MLAAINHLHFEDDGDDAKALEGKKKKEKNKGLLACVAGSLTGALTGGGGAPSGAVGHDDGTLAVAVAWLLIDAGADVHAVARGGATPLHFAAKVLGSVLGSHALCRGQA